MADSIQQPVVARGPATIANVGPGFDVLGLAVAEPFDEVTVWPDATVRGAVVEQVQGEADGVPTGAANTAAVAAAAVLEQAHGWLRGVRIHLRKGLPGGSGLGSSGASAAAAAVATATLLGGRLDRIVLLRACMRAEHAACGTAHADNVAPALWGGAVVVVPDQPPRVVPLPLHRPLWCALALPAIEVLTARARAVMPRAVPLPDVTFSAGRLAALVATLMDGQFERLRWALDDRVHVPYRSQLVPGCGAVFEAARDAGALGVSLSGSGPTIFALAPDAATAHAVAAAMQQAFADDAALGCRTWVTRIDPRGARVVEGAAHA